MHDAKGIQLDGCVARWHDPACATTATATACSRLHHRPDPPSSPSHRLQPHMQPMERDLALAVKQPSHGRCSCSCQPGLLLRAQFKQLARIGVVESSRCPQVRPWWQKAAASLLWYRCGCVWLRLVALHAHRQLLPQPTVGCTTPRASSWMLAHRDDTVTTQCARHPRLPQHADAFTIAQTRSPASATSHNLACSRWSATWHWQSIGTVS